MMLPFWAITQKSTPQLFLPDIVSTPLQERDMAISLSGDSLVYTIGNGDQKVRGLFLLKKSEGQWGKPELLSFSGQYQDIEPFFDPRGQKLFFASNRPLVSETKAGDYNIWYVEYKNGKWSTPTALDSTINGEKDDFYPSVAQNGNLYFTSTREDGVGLEDIFFSELSSSGYLKPVALSKEINSEKYEFNAFVAPNESFLIFSSFGRSDGLGGGDLYISVKDQAGHWQEAENLGKDINTSFLDYCPFVGNDGVFYWTSNRYEKPEQINSYEDLKAFSNSNLSGNQNIFFIPASAIIKNRDE